MPIILMWEGRIKEGLTQKTTLNRLQHTEKAAKISTGKPANVVPQSRILLRNPAASKKETGDLAAVKWLFVGAGSGSLIWVAHIKTGVSNWITPAPSHVIKTVAPASSLSPSRMAHRTRRWTTSSFSSRRGMPWPWTSKRLLRELILRRLGWKKGQNGCF